MPFAAFGKHGGITQRIATSCICTIGVIGGILGMAFNVYLIDQPFFSFVPMRSLIYHMLMLIVPVVLWSSKYYKPKLLDAILFYIPVLVLLVPAYFLNVKFGWDYCYLNGASGTPLELITKHMPRGTFNFSLYFAMYLSSVSLFFMPTMLKHFKAFKENKITI